MITLPELNYQSSHSLEECIKRRQSVREYKDSALTLEEISQLLWAAQSAPSAGATYPLFIYLVAGKVNGLKAGIYKYEPEKHALKEILNKDIRRPLAEAALGQSWVSTAPVSIVIVADYARTTARYGQRGIRYVHMEVGHVGQNIYLE